MYNSEGGLCWVLGVAMFCPCCVLVKRRHHHCQSAELSVKGWMAPKLFEYLFVFVNYALTYALRYASTLMSA
jgi:hypothetical protein